ncbi:hypothetical protein [uncultured Cohaesibacter sp.]|uniref:hypothetical protein n=1 Tax=uncultured Cohaesibacter sp. TaxID=1002546 RepID=UPI0029C89BEE|nr:hypothetical protein [uncultured Cohaesibacter sp.]
MPETPPELDLAPHKTEISGASSSQGSARRRRDQFDRDTRDKLIALLIVFILLAAFFLYIQN